MSSYAQSIFIYGQNMALVEEVIFYLFQIVEYFIKGLPGGTTIDIYSIQIVSCEL